MKKKINKIKQRLHPTFTSVEYPCGGMLHIEPRLNSYQTISLNNHNFMGLIDIKHC